MCSGQTHCFNDGALDPDGDSLSYSLVTPFSSSGSSFVYFLPPYSATQPLPSDPPCTINPVTGEICMSPTMNFSYLFAVRVEEWRTINQVPTLIGSVHRDIHVIVNNCSNEIPLLGGIDTTHAHGYTPNDSVYSMDVCAGEPVSFTLWGHDDDVYNASVTGNPELFSITWNQGIPSGSFQPFYQDTDSAKAVFSWTPTNAHVNNAPHCFTATIRDNACPYNGLQTFAYCFTVHGISVNLGNDTAIGLNEVILLDAGPGYASYSWSTGDTTRQILVDSTGTGTGTAIVWVVVTDTHGCVGTDTILVEFRQSTIIHPKQNEQDQKAHFEIVPNPSGGIFELIFDEIPIDRATIQILSPEGKVAERISVSSGLTNRKLMLDLYQLPEGLYFIRVQWSGGMVSRKLMIIK